MKEVLRAPLLLQWCITLQCTNARLTLLVPPAVVTDGAFTEGGEEGRGGEAGEEARSVGCKKFVAFMAAAFLVAGRALLCNKHSYWLWVN